MPMNVAYRAPGDLPDVIPVFPLAGALLLSGAVLIATALVISPPLIRSRAARARPLPPNYAPI